MGRNRKKEAQGEYAELADGVVLRPSTLFDGDADTLDGQHGSFYQNAGNLNTGTIPDARFPATLPALNGSALTSLNASNLASGSIPAARMGNVINASTHNNNTATIAAMDVNEFRRVAWVHAGGSNSYNIKLPSGGSYYVHSSSNEGVTGIDRQLSGGATIGTTTNGDTYYFIVWRIA